MGADGWITTATIAVMVVVMARGVLSPPAAVVGATAFVFAVGVVDADDALSGLSNEAPATIAGLYVVAGALSRTGLLSPLVGAALGRAGGARGGRRSLARLLVPSSAASAVLANTPIVAMLVPAVVRWADDRRDSASRYLLPMSYATILGGTLTLVGTSTNLVASGLADEAGLGPFELFDTGRVSWPLVVVGLVLLVVLSPVVVPARRRPLDADPDADRPFTVVMRVVPGGPVVGRTVEDAGLRHLEGVYLAEIERSGSVVAPVAPDRRLSAGDHLVFVGDVARVVDLHARPGLETVADGGPPLAGGVFHEGVVGPTSGLVGRTLRDTHFRARHQAAVVAIHRAGERLGAKLGRVVIRPGDSLLMVTGPDFEAGSAAVRDDFLLVTRLGPVPDGTRRWTTPVVLVALAVVVVLPALGATSVLRAVTIAVGLLIATTVLAPRDVWELVDLNVVVMIAAAFGLGRAVQVSGLADEVADGIISFGEGWGDLGAVLGVLLAVMILTELVTNAAAVALVFPTALSVAAGLDLDPATMAAGVAVASSSSFLTPIGYQTNTMVWGPGRYRFEDYVRLGAPLWAVSWIGTSAMVVTLG